MQVRSRGRPYLRSVTVIVFGRFPPPIDGQALATEHLASLLEPHGTVRRIDSMYAGARLFGGKVAEFWTTLIHYVRVRERLKLSLAAVPGAPILWCSISPSILGHFRDILLSKPSFKGHPVCAVIHRGNFDRLFRRGVTRFSALRMAQRVDKFVFNSTELSLRASNYIEAGKRVVIPNTARMGVSRQELEVKLQGRLRRADLHLLYLSNMIPSKGYEDVLEAVALLRERQVVGRATFAGRWDSEAARSAFLERVSMLGLNELVEVPGPIHDRERVKEVHLSADVFLLPTYYSSEAQPHAVIEALEAATPVVVTPHASLPEMVRDGKEARFVEPKTPSDIVAAVEGIASDWPRAAQYARERYEEVFSDAAVGKQWQTLVDDLCTLFGYRESS